MDVLVQKRSKVIGFVYSLIKTLISRVPRFAQFGFPEVGNLGGKANT